ncbi:MAG: class C beta-lactamase [Pseudomonadota bacterium]|nr:class C beta-lactamase [Pseudomonadota bacterium]
MLRSPLAALAITALFFVPASHARAAEAKAQTPLDEAVASAIHPTMAKHGIPGMAVAVHVRGQRHYFNYGVASKETDAPVSPETLFEIGSVSKVYGATLAAYAEASGALDLNAPLSRYLPQLKGSAFDHINVLQAATYSAGGLPLQIPDTIHTDAEALRWLHGWQPQSAPGSQRLYSNPSIGLMGMAAASSLQQPCTEAMQRTLVAGLKLRQTWVNIPAAEMPNYAQGYSSNDQPVRIQDAPMCAGSWGSLKTSSRGLMDFLEANLNAARLAPAWQRAIASTQTGWYQTPLNQQGLGWEIYPWPLAESQLIEGNSQRMSGQPNPVSLIDKPQRAASVRLLNKTGGTNGFSAYVVLLPGRDIAILMLANKGGWPRDERVLAAHALLRLLDEGER